MANMTLVPTANFPSDEHPGSSPSFVLAERKILHPSQVTCVCENHSTAQSDPNMLAFFKICYKAESCHIHEKCLWQLLWCVTATQRPVWTNWKDKILLPFTIPQELSMWFTASSGLPNPIKWSCLIKQSHCLLRSRSTSGRAACFVNKLTLHVMVICTWNDLVVKPGNSGLWLTWTSFFMLINMLDVILRHSVIEERHRGSHYHTIISVRTLYVLNMAISQDVAIPVG